jgi:hypothetical protein
MWIALNTKNFWFILLIISLFWGIFFDKVIRYCHKFVTVGGGSDVILLENVAGKFANFFVELVEFIEVFYKHFIYSDTILLWKNELEIVYYKWQIGKLEKQIARRKNIEKALFSDFEILFIVVQVLFFVFQFGYKYTSFAPSSTPYLDAYAKSLELRIPKVGEMVKNGWKLSEIKLLEYKPPLEYRRIRDFLDGAFSEDEMRQKAAQICQSTKELQRKTMNKVEFLNKVAWPLQKEAFYRDPSARSFVRFHAVSDVAFELSCPRYKDFWFGWKQNYR